MLASTAAATAFEVSGLARYNLPVFRTPENGGVKASTAVKIRKRALKSFMFQTFVVVEVSLAMREKLLGCRNLFLLKC